jgi:hypothetical protein
MVPIGLLLFSARAGTGTVAAAVVALVAGGLPGKAAWGWPGLAVSWRRR